MAKRRTHGAYRTEEECRRAARDLVCLLNGMPPGYVLMMGRRLGAWVLYSVHTNN